LNEAELAAAAEEKETHSFEVDPSQVVRCVHGYAVSLFEVNLPNYVNLVLSLHLAG